MGENPSTPADALRELLESDDHWMIRADAATHPNTPADAVAQAGEHDRHRTVRPAAAKRLGLAGGGDPAPSDPAFAEAASPDTGAERLGEMVRHDNWQVRRAVAQNPAAAAGTVATLIYDGHLAVREAAICHPDCPGWLVSARVGEIIADVRADAERRARQTMLDLAADEQSRTPQPHPRAAGNNASDGSDLLLGGVAGFVLGGLFD